ncbi:uncharacterized protein [Haliotis asinina]|uniref:uncharacterized protein n=1 Tax=Haliotis asinina TaxID=109174 RepID=UPI00353217BB
MSDVSLTSKLSDLQSAELTRQRRQLELAELKRQAIEDAKVDEEMRVLNDKAYLARMEAEEQMLRARKRAEDIERLVIRQREKRNTELGRERRIRKAENSLKEADLLASMIGIGLNPPAAVTTSTTITSSTHGQQAVMANVENQVEQVVFKTEKTNQEVNPSTLHSVHNAMPVPYEKETCVKQDEPSLPPNFPNIAAEPFQSAPVHPSSGDTSFGPQTYGPPSFPHGQTPPMIPNMTELLISSSYGIPRPTLRLFNSEKEKDFAILKMALDNLVNVHTHLTEQYKYQLLLDRLGGRAKRLAEAYMYAPQPYSEAFEALKNKYGQPRQLVQGELGAILSMPFVKFGDNEAFENFALAVHSLVGMLKSLDGGQMETYAVLDDGSQRTIILTSTAERLKLCGRTDEILLSTIRHESYRCTGKSVNLSISPGDSPQIQYPISNAFTSPSLCLSEYTYPVKDLQIRWPHLRDYPLPSIYNAQPVILIGSDYADLILPQEPVHFGPKGAPVAVHTRLGWSLQGQADMHLPRMSQTVEQCLLTSSVHRDPELWRNVEKLWQVDAVPNGTKDVTRSKQDKQALETLETFTERVEMYEVVRYATPLLRIRNGVSLNATEESVKHNLIRTERRLKSNPELAHVHKEEIQKLVDAGYVKIISPEEAGKSAESWYIPHHIVQHNGKNRLVFNCSYSYEGRTLNENLLPGPLLGSSLIGVLLRFRQHSVAVSGDIKAMFHQVRLLPKDRPLLRFIWRDMDQTVPPNIYEWQVLPFGTTCSPCCAIYALQTHAHGHKEENPDVYRSVATVFYVDNCLDSVPTAAEAKELVHDMSALLDKGGFHLRQWISNVPSVVADLPTEDQAANCERWLSLGEAGLTEGTLGLQWQCDSDVLGYRVKEISHDCLTMKVIYRILASQYDPLGYLTPFTARAKVIVQDLWKLKRDWDAPIVEGSEYEKWCSWENELPSIENVNLPRCYTPHHVDTTNSVQQLHIFSDASERVYGAVAFLRTVYQGKVYVSFVQARSRVAPKRQLSIPRLELSAALVGAQLADMLNRELTLPIERVTLWSDSTTVLSWLKSDSCRYKVFVGTRVAEIQTLTNVADWRYVNTKDNPADDLTRGKTLEELANSSAWQNGPPFLQQSPDEWPPDIVMSSSIKDTSGEVKSTFCAVTMAESPTIPEVSKYSNWRKLVADTMQILNGAAKDTQVSFDWIKTEMFLFRKVQCDSFPEEFSALQSHKKLPTDSRLAQLDPVYDNENNVIRVGGRLRRAESLSCDAQHPVVLDPHHQITQLIIKDFDERLLHYGAERILAEIRRKFWILRGREAIRQHQRKCATCRKSRAQPQLPKMSDLPPSRLRLYKPAFYSTGVDCFGPMTIKIGRRTEKRWGVIFKCMTTRAVHFDLLDSMSTDAFLMAFRRFVARRGKPHELLSDCGSNFKGAERELRETWNHGTKSD